jgi:hypothetical protein
MSNPTQRVRLTQTKIDHIVPPATGETVIHDSEAVGLSLRIRAGGHRSWIVRYHLGNVERRLTLGDARKVPLAAARDACRLAQGELAKGIDVVAARKETARRQRARLGVCVEDYGEDLRGRSVVSAGHIISLLRRELVGPLGATTDISTLDRARLVARFSAVAASGRPSAAYDLRLRTSVFFNWAAERGFLAHNPLLGLRRRRATRAQMLARPGRALREDELRAFWKATEVAGGDDPYWSTYLRALLLSGARRTEMSRARWRHVQDVDGGPALVLPRELTKNGHAHIIPLQARLLAMLTALPRRPDTDLIFPTWRGNDTAFGGWGHRWRRIVETMRREGTQGRIVMHDLRRSARSWWGEIGIAHEVAELLLNHRARSSLASLYDRSERLGERRAALERWCAKLFEIVGADAGNVDKAAIHVPAFGDAVPLSTYAETLVAWDATAGDVPSALPEPGRDVNATASDIAVEIGPATAPEAAADARAAHSVSGKRPRRAQRTSTPPTPLTAPEPITAAAVAPVEAMIMGKRYRRDASGRYVPVDDA